MQETANSQISDKTGLKVHIRFNFHGLDWSSSGLRENNKQITDNGKTKLPLSSTTSQMCAFKPDMYMTVVSFWKPFVKPLETAFIPADFFGGQIEAKVCKIIA